MPQRPAGATPARAPERIEEPASTVPGPALGRIVTATRMPVRGQLLTVTPGIGPLPAIYLPTGALNPYRAGRGRTAHLRALALRVVCLLAGVRHRGASKGGHANASARRLRPIS
jgi:hypothetical protein